MMKFNVFCCSFLLPFFAYATDETPVLTKKTATGYVAPGYNTAIECQVYQNKVSIRYIAGMAAVKYEKPISLGGGMNWMIDEARHTAIKRNIVPSDAGTVVYQAFYNNEYAMLEVVELGTIAGNAWALENSSVGAYGLRYLLDNLCK